MDFIINSSNVSRAVSRSNMERRSDLLVVSCSSENLRFSRRVDPRAIGPPVLQGGSTPSTPGGKVMSPTSATSDKHLSLM